MSKQPKVGPAEEAPMLPPIPVESKNPGTPPIDPQGEHPKAEGQPPAPAPASTPTPGPKYPRPEPGHRTPRHRFLSPPEWGVVAHGVGGIRDREDQTPIHPSNWWWPPKGMPRGLYKDTVTQRTKFFILYHTASSVRWILMILQLFIGAALTALGSMSLHDGTPITILGASNTVIAGLLAFLQNSGLPDRYRYDKAEFEALEDHIKELLDSGIAPADQATDQILAECFDLYQDAKATVFANLPANYTSQLAQQAAQRKSPMIQLGPQSASKASAVPFGGDGAGNPSVGK